MEELVNRAKYGDKDAFTELIYSFKQDLFKIARMRLSCEDDIDDAIQETIIEAFTSIKKLKNTQFFKQWVFKILINKCNKIYKKRKKYNISFENLEMENMLKTYSIDEYNKELEFYDMLKCLNYKERITAILYFKEDYSTKDISKILDTNENTIKTRIKRAKNKIKSKYERSE